MIKQLTLFLGLTFVGLSSADAIELAKALYLAKVCERSDGYIQATPGNESEMSDLVADVNKKRTSIYEGIAINEGISSAEVGAMRAREEKAENPENFCR